MRILICDDQAAEVEKLLTLCKKYAEDRGIDAEISGTTDPDFIEENLPEILLLDVEMPKISGIEIKDRLSLGDLPLIIFVTSHEESMLQAFGRNVIGFLVKPAEYNQLSEYLDTAVNILSLGRIVVFEDGSAADSRDMVMINVEREYSYVLLRSGEKKTLIRKSMRAWEGELAGCGFLRISDSCMVNCGFIKKFEGNQVILRVDALKKKVSRRKKAECLKRYQEYCVKAARYF